MRFALYSKRLRLVPGVLLIVMLHLVSSAATPTSLSDDPLSTEQHSPNLGRLAQPMRWVLWLLPGALLGIAVVLTKLRYRVSTNLYKTSSDEQWNQDSRSEVGEQVDAKEVIGACQAFENPTGQDEAAQPVPEPAPVRQGRLFTPASGPAWSESMLEAFLRTCMKVNCLGRTWRESAARRLQTSNLPDAREAELIRKLIQRWQEFHVDPETGVFLDRSGSGGKNHVCIISVSKDKHTLVEAGLNAGFVIESLGRYLKHSDLVYRQPLGNYHAPTQDELKAMTPGERESMIPITEIPDPWQVMISGRRAE